MSLKSTVPALRAGRTRCFLLAMWDHWLLDIKGVNDIPPNIRVNRHNGLMPHGAASRLIVVFAAILPGRFCYNVSIQK